MEFTQATQLVTKHANEFIFDAHLAREFAIQRKYKVSLYDNKGCKIFDQEIFYQGNNEKVSISLNKLNLTGNYKLVLLKNDKVIKQENLNF